MQIVQYLNIRKCRQSPHGGGDAAERQHRRHRPPRLSPLLLEQVLFVRAVAAAAVARNGTSRLVAKMKGGMGRVY